MQAKSDVEFERYKLMKVARTLIRLKHSIEADRELNQLLPDSLLEFDQGVQNGELLAPTEALLRDILES